MPFRSCMSRGADTTRPPFGLLVRRRLCKLCGSCMSLAVKRKHLPSSRRLQIALALWDPQNTPGGSHFKRSLLKVHLNNSSVFPESVPSLSCQPLCNRLSAA